mmetsp:Transcript_35262/g.92540  ORF Transcript_35262/g.92540 Transcript_35262/m.92540 type:complete len:221 (+) Transcript_35262:213-875(+)
MSVVSVWPARIGLARPHVASILSPSEPRRSEHAAATWHRCGRLCRLSMPSTTDSTPLTHARVRSRPGTRPLVLTPSRARMLPPVPRCPCEQQQDHREGGGTHDTRPRRRRRPSCRASWQRSFSLVPARPSRRSCHPPSVSATTAATRIDCRRWLVIAWITSASLPVSTLATCPRHARSRTARAHRPSAQAPRSTGARGVHARATPSSSHGLTLGSRSRPA